MADNYRLPAMPTGDPGTGPLIRAIDNGGILEQVVRVRGHTPGELTGTITTATSIVGDTLDLSYVGNISVSISGTYAGVNVIFEAKVAGQAIWVPIIGTRTDTGISEMTSGVIPSNASRSWAFNFVGYTNFRVRTTAWTSGTATVVLDPQTLPTATSISSIYSPPIGRSQRLVLLENEAGINADTIITTLQHVNPAGTAPVTAQTSITVAAGKTFRITHLYFMILVATATTPPWIRMRLRFNPSGAAALASPMVGSWVLGPQNTTLNASSGYEIALPPEGLELNASATAAGGFGFSKSGPATTPTNSQINMVLMGYEF